MSKPPNDNLTTYELVVLGDRGVGKSALAIRFFHNLSVDEVFGSDPGTFNLLYMNNCYRQQTEVDGQWCMLEVLLHSEEEQFLAVYERYMRKVDGFLLVYSVTDEQSFEKIRHFHTSILHLKDRDSCPMLLVANKVDLVHLRKVTEEQGKELAVSLKIPYIETSAQVPLNVDAAFHEIVRIIRNQPPTMDKRSHRFGWFRRVHCTIL